MGALRGVALTGMGVALRGWAGPGRGGSLRERRCSVQQPPPALPPLPPVPAEPHVPTSGCLRLPAPAPRPGQGLGGSALLPGQPRREPHPSSGAASPRAP